MPNRAIPIRAIPALSRRVLSRLEQAELSELDPHLCDDIRIAWIVVLFASRGNSQPLIDASYYVLGLHPEKVWPAIQARRKALLGWLYEEFWAERHPESSAKLPPKKAAHSDRHLPDAKAA